MKHKINLEISREELDLLADCLHHTRKQIEEFGGHERSLKMAEVLKKLENHLEEIAPIKLAIK